MDFRKSIKKNKYNNKKIVNEFGTWDSKKEHQRYMFLQEAEKKGLIRDLKRQVRFELIPAIKEEYIEHLKTKDKVKTRTLQHAICYTCDFRYSKDGVVIVEDVKASPKMLPKEFILKEKLMFWRYGIRIKRVYKADEKI